MNADDIASLACVARWRAAAAYADTPDRHSKGSSKDVIALLHKVCALVLVGHDGKEGALLHDFGPMPLDMQRYATAVYYAELARLHALAEGGAS